MMWSLMWCRHVHTSKMNHLSFWGFGSSFRYVYTCSSLKWLHVSSKVSSISVLMRSWKCLSVSWSWLGRRTTFKNTLILSYTGTSICIHYVHMCSVLVCTYYYMLSIYVHAPYTKWDQLVFMRRCIFKCQINLMLDLTCTSQSANNTIDLKQFSLHYGIS